MASRPTRSLKHEYELHVEEEIESYKESIPRSALLSIGDEAVASLSEEPQFALTELLLAQEVDRIIFRRLRLPGYQTWRRRRLSLLRELRRPEHWGLHPDDVVVRAVKPAGETRVLVAGAAAEAPALYLAANGCEVTAVLEEEDVLERVLSAAAAAGIAERVHAHRTDWSAWAPEAELHAVIVTTAALRGLTAAQRAKVIRMLQSATADGGVHLVQTVDLARTAPSLRELESRYQGWSVSVEHESSGGDMFLARKELA
jgi:Tellurite resistance protein TehB